MATQQSSPLQQKLEEMEKRLKETEAQLVKEKSASAIFMEALGNKQGPELEAAQKDIQIALLKQQTELLLKRFDENEKTMNDKLNGIVSKVENMKFAPAGGANIQVLLFPIFQLPVSAKS